jgi:glycosyltransferase involved in cell wall biosynthesis
MDNAKERNIKVLVLGPTPPPIGGCSVLVEQFINYLEKERVDYNCIDTSFKGKAADKIYKFVCIIAKCIWNIRRAKSVTLHCSTKMVYTLGPIVLTFCKLSNSSLVIRKFGGSFHKTYEESSYIKKQIIYTVIQNADTLFCETIDMMRYFSDTKSINNVKWLPNSRKKYGSVTTPKPGSKVVYVGQIKYEKGIIELVKAVTFASNNITVKFYGPVGKKIERDFLSRLEESESCWYEGIVNFHSVQSVLSDHDILALPSRWPHEGYPGVIIEAFMCGLPVVVSRAGAIPEIVTEKNGCFVDSESPKEIANAIDSLVSDKMMYKSIRKNNLKVGCCFDSSMWSKALLDECG